MATQTDVAAVQDTEGLPFDDTFSCFPICARIQEPWADFFSVKMRQACEELLFHIVQLKVKKRLRETVQEIEWRGNRIRRLIYLIAGGISEFDTVTSPKMMLTPERIPRSYYEAFESSYKLRQVLDEFHVWFEECGGLHNRLSRANVEYMFVLAKRIVWCYRR